MNNIRFLLWQISQLFDRLFAPIQNNFPTRCYSCNKYYPRRLTKTVRKTDDVLVNFCLGCHDHHFKPFTRNK